MAHQTRASIVLGQECDLDEVLRTGPFHTALRVAIQQRRLSLQRLRVRLAERGVRVSVSSLSEWQQGRTRPGGANAPRIVEALGEILDVPPAALATLLSMGSSPGRRHQGVNEHAGPFGELLDGLPGSRTWDLEIISQEHRVFVDARRIPSRLRSTSLVRARRDGVDRYQVCYFAAEGGVVDDVIVKARRNCRVGDVHRHPSGLVLAADLLFDEALRANQTWVFEREIIDPTPCNEFSHAFRHPEAHFLAEVEFHPDALPQECFVWAQADLDSEPRRLAPLPLNRFHTAHIAATDRSTGLLGIGWKWPTERHS
ncbi:MAG TPA: helix-turn-helix transcriptional regulator [Pseudonocardiaceae bacterium]|jgi:hypothetical protein|nr:helix-turn-helix transcriptional regulator [Pseudonocardiaceae bacterium]